MENNIVVTMKAVYRGSSDSSESTPVTISAATVPFAYYAPLPATSETTTQNPTTAVGQAVLIPSGSAKYVIISVTNTASAVVYCIEGNSDTFTAKYKYVVGGANASPATEFTTAEMLYGDKWVKFIGDGTQNLFITTGN
jgi:hypothetical protein